jgi:hypothetical protein
MRTEELVQPLVDPFDVRAGVEAPLDPRLVGHADHEVAMVVRERQRVTDASEQLEPFRLLQVVEVGVEGAVPVDEQRTPERAR